MTQRLIIRKDQGGRNVKPYYEHDGITIYHGDCREVLPTIDLEANAVCITDPPFGVRSEDWDNMDEMEFARFSMEWLSVVRGKTDELVSFCSAYGPFRRIVEMLFSRVRVMVWDKPLGSQYGGSSERGLWFAHETILHGYQKKEYAKPKTLEIANAIKAARKSKGLSCGGVDMVIRGRKTGLCYRWEEAACLPTPEQAEQLAKLLDINGQLQDLLQQAYAGKESTIANMREDQAEGRDVFTYRTETNGIHPCEKPVGLMAELIYRLITEDQTILDPFMGSGTTLRAAKDLQRRAIGIEIEERYCEIAAKRLDQGVFDFQEETQAEEAASRE